MKCRFTQNLQNPLSSEIERAPGLDHICRECGPARNPAMHLCTTWFQCTSYYPAHTSHDDASSEKEKSVTHPLSPPRTRRQPRPSSCHAFAWPHLPHSHQGLWNTCPHGGAHSSLVSL
eukprot:GHVU01228881.1.p1 GENE.GHVU01228881.1~~GHVU01228881.1.p1  ORF type:complete len:118 (+),score=2.20 GHVU01228881.1:41-394(+)